MSETYQLEPFQCGDTAALVTYLYDECADGERHLIATHLAACADCAEELKSLGSTRTHLAAWTPPEIALGFRMTSARESAAPRDDSRGATVLRPARWWNQPLPAWSQAAAAVLIFASGMAIGITRQGAQPAPSAAPAAVQATVQPASALSTAPAVSPRDLQDLERRLRGEIAQARPVAVTGAPARGDEETFRRVQALIADSEQRQQRELAMRTAEIVRDMDTQRRVDLAQVQRTVGQIQDLTGAAVRDQNDMFNYLVKVSSPRR